MSIILSFARCEEIKQSVVRTYVRYDVHCIPIDSFELAAKMGVKVIPYSRFSENIQRLLNKKSKDGFSTEKELGEWYIHYNDTMPGGRIKNTIMHEIGHIVLDHTEDSELANKEVNFFAKYALAPPVLIHKMSLKDPDDIAAAFGISHEAACNALNYYKKWLELGEPYYKDYELTLLNLFSNAG